MSPFFTMYLKKRPWYYRKGDEIREVNFTTEVRDLVALGYERVDVNGNPLVVASRPAPEKIEEPKKPEPKEEKVDLKSLTRADLVELAASKDVEVKPYATKADIIKALEKSNG